MFGVVDVSGRRLPSLGGPHPNLPPAGEGIIGLALQRGAFDSALVRCAGGAFIILGVGFGPGWDAVVGDWAGPVLSGLLMIAI